MDASNTRYFHLTIVIHRKSNVIDHFKLSVSDANNMLLCSIPTDEDVKNTIFLMNSYKCPGPDGFNPLFFKIIGLLCKVL